MPNKLFVSDLLTEKLTDGLIWLNHLNDDDDDNNNNNLVL